VISFKPAQKTAEFDAARTLIVDYSHELGVDLGFQGITEELAGLDRVYSPPHGRLVIAWHGKEAVGCVGLKQIDGATCEMKRMYVKPDFRGRKIGLGLANRIMNEGKKLHYAAMRLDTLVSLQAAVALYRRLGFHEIEPYYENPLPDVLYFERRL
jgi:ribosomal protein S18 acetylase RimI-like enzyme